METMSRESTRPRVSARGIDSSPIGLRAICCRNLRSASSRSTTSRNCCCCAARSSAEFAFGAVIGTYLPSLRSRRTCKRQPKFRTHSPPMQREPLRIHPRGRRKQARRNRPIRAERLRRRPAAPNTIQHRRYWKRSCVQPGQAGSVPINDHQSRPTRGAWIETATVAVRDALPDRRAPRGARGLKQEFGRRTDTRVARRAPRGARGLKLLNPFVSVSNSSRAPRGARGLKQDDWLRPRAVAQSRPTRGAWIETTQGLRAPSWW